MESLIPLIVAIVSLSMGSVFGYLARQTIAKQQLGSIEEKIETLTKKAKNEADEIVAHAKEQATETLAKIKQEELKSRNQIIYLERKLEKQEDNLGKRRAEMESNQHQLEQKIVRVKQIRQEVETLKQRELETLEKLAQLSVEKAKDLLFKKIEENYQQELAAKYRKLESEEQEAINEKAKNLIAQAMQRCAQQQASEFTTTSVPLPNNELKGRIIGKEGRNIRVIEQITGVELMIDDTPDVIVVSAFDPVRRHIAKIALEKLLSDGRINPARIESAVEEAKVTINQKVKEAGEAAIFDLGLVGFDPKLVNLIGRLRFRTSYGQNVLIHSLEVAHLAGALAAELGSNVSTAKKAGLLHDIGKAVDSQIQGTHVEIGINILKRFGTDETIIKAMQSHHNEYPEESMEAVIVQVADAISGSRPGARKDTLENYLKRLEDLENVAKSFDGVEKSYAIQAGRELRVFVSPSKIDDLTAIKLSKDIAKKIEQELSYPGEIKVNVIRETRSVEYAK